MRTTLLVIALATAGCSTTVVCPPDNHPTQFVKCDSPQVFSRDVAATAKVNLEYSGKKIADIDAALASRVNQLSSTLTNQTIQYQSLLQALCQQRNADPCNTKYQEHLADAIQSVSIQMLSIKQQTDELRIVADKPKTSSSTSDLTDTLDKLEGTVAKQPSTVVPPASTSGSSDQHKG
jgi:phage protein D